MAFHDHAGETQSSILAGMRLSKGEGVRRDAQSRFFLKYRLPMIAWLKARSLQDCDAEDIASDVLNSLYNAMGTFSYDGTNSFRSYLVTCLYNAVRRYRKRQSKIGFHHLSTLELSPELQADLSRHLQDQVDRELYDIAKQRVRVRVSDRDWEIFESLSNGEVSTVLADRFKLTLNALYNAKRRVIARLQEEVRSLQSHGL